MINTNNADITMTELGAELMRLDAEITALQAALKQISDYHDNGQPHPKHLQELAREWAKNITVLARSAQVKYRQIADGHGLHHDTENDDG